MERKVGEVFEYKGATLIVKESSGNCEGCNFLRANDLCLAPKPIIGECVRGKREDARDVVFVKVQDMNKENHKSILSEAEEIVNGSRQADYGDAKESFTKVASVASVMTGKELSPDDCCAVLMAVKLVRESFRHKRDNLVDLCGYAEIMNRINEKEKEGE